MIIWCHNVCERKKVGRTRTILTNKYKEYKEDDDCSGDDDCY